MYGETKYVNRFAIERPLKVKFVQGLTHSDFGSLCLVNEPHYTDDIVQCSILPLKTNRKLCLGSTIAPLELTLAERERSKSPRL